MGNQCVEAIGSDWCKKPSNDGCGVAVAAAANMTSSLVAGPANGGGAGGNAGGGGPVGGPYTNGDGRNAPNYDYYLNPDQGQLRYTSLWSAQDFMSNYGVSVREAQAMFNSAMHKPESKQEQFLATFTEIKAAGILNPTFNDVKSRLVEKGYNPNDPFQNTEITAWTNWFAQGDLYDNLM